MLRHSGRAVFVPMFTCAMLLLAVLTYPTGLRTVLGPAHQQAATLAHLVTVSLGLLPGQVRPTDATPHETALTGIFSPAGQPGV